MSGLFGGGSGGGSAPNPPAPQLANISNLENQAVSADTIGYNLSDADLAARFPGLVSGRNQQVTDAYNQLTGPLNSTAQNSFTTQGLEQSLSSFGGGNPNATINKGASSGNAVETSLANNVQKKQDYDRTYFENLIGANPQRQFGLAGSDVANLEGANVAAQNAYNQSKYAAQYGNYNAQQASSSSQSNATLGAIASIAAAALVAFSDKRIKEDVKDTGAKTPDKIPIKTFKFKHDPKHRTRIGIVAQDAEKKRPDLVSYDPMTGLKRVDYGRILAEAIR
jgi:endosialidase-like protein